MAYQKLLCLTTLVLGLLLSTVSAQATSPCPPVVPLLSFDRPDWVIAQINIVESVPYPPGAFVAAAKVEVERVFAGALDSDIVIVEDDSVLDCGAFISNLPIGSRWVIGMAGPNAYGSYGGSTSLALARIDEDVITSAIPGFQSSGENKSLDEFAAFVNTLTPRAQTGNYLLSMKPRLPGPFDSTYLSVKNEPHVGCFIHPNGVSLDRRNNVIQVSFEQSQVEVSPCPESLRTLDIALPPFGIPSGQDYYTVRVYQEALTSGATPFQESKQIASFEYPVRDPIRESNAEVPAQDSVQSGVGVIRGWACEARRVEVQLDDRPRMQLAYGTLRTDTRNICGDSNNGYGAVYAWGLLGAGQHTMRTYIGNTLIDTIEFEVAGLNDEFAIGLDATYELEDFPTPGQSVTVRWSEAAQNFIIVEHLK